MSLTSYDNCSSKAVNSVFNKFNNVTTQIKTLDDNHNQKKYDKTKWWPLPMINQMATLMKIWITKRQKTKILDYNLDDNTKWQSHRRLTTFQTKNMMATETKNQITTQMSKQITTYMTT
jgi:hypothetical protein